MEALLDPSNPLHWAVVVVLLVSGLACAFVGVRDGFVRREVRTNGGLLTGRRALLAGALYVGTGLAGVWGALAFVARSR